MKVILEVKQEPAFAGAARVRLSGELDMTTAPRLSRVLARVPQAPVLIVDLRELQFMDSTGLNLLLQAELRARREGWRLVLVRGPRAVQRVFEIAGLVDHLTFTDDPATLPPAAGNT